MLSEIKNRCKRLFEWLKINNKEIYLAIVIILVATISFGLGRLSKIREEKTPITVENVATSASSTPDFEKRQSPAPVSNDKTDKIFVASRNGKKYYYAWCDAAKTIKEQNRVWFSSEEEAKKSGYEPATNCRGLK